MPAYPATSMMLKLRRVPEEPNSDCVVVGHEAYKGAHFRMDTLDEAGAKQGDVDAECTEDTDLDFVVDSEDETRANQGDKDEEYTEEADNSFDADTDMTESDEEFLDDQRGVAEEARALTGVRFVSVRSATH